MTRASSLDIRVNSNDLDKYGHVNYATYLKWYEWGHLQLLEQTGLGDFDQLERTRGLRTFIVHIEVDYKAQLFLGDKITLTTLIEKIGNTSMVYHQFITCAGSPVSEAQMTAVFVDLDAKPIKIPAEVREKLET